MKKSLKKQQKLVLSKETVRSLDLKSVQGGVNYTNDDGCFLSMQSFCTLCQIP